MKKSHSNPVGKAIRLFLIVLFISFEFGCHKPVKDSETPLPEKTASARMASGNKKVHFPEEDPGAPFYMRAGNSLNQFFVYDGWLVIPFFRNPSCIRPDFNLLNIFDVPASFGCELTVNGFYMIERDVPAGTFPLIVQSTGSAVPFWFVRWEDFQAAMSDGVVTIGELQSLNPLVGSATKFHETLRPRANNHLVQINAAGVLDDGRTFDFHVTHVGNQTKNISLTIK